MSLDPEIQGHVGSVIADVGSDSRGHPIKLLARGSMHGKPATSKTLPCPATKTDGRQTLTPCNTCVCNFLRRNCKSPPHAELLHDVLGPSI